MKSSFLHIRQRIRNTVILFLLCTFFALGFSMYSSYREKADELFRDSLSHVRIIAEHAARTFGEVDRVLDIVIARSLTPDRLSQINEHELFDAFTVARKGIPQIASIYFINSNGILSASSLEYPIKKVNLADREFFQHLQNTRGDEPYISKPYRNRITNKWNFVFSQRINSADGSFAGIIGASFEISYFEKLYDELNIDSTQKTALIRIDGFPVILHPPIDKELLHSEKTHSLFTRYLPRAPAGVYREKSTGPLPVDQVIAYSVLPSGYPLIAKVTYDWNSAFAVWQRDALVKAALFFVFSGLALFLTRMLLQRLFELEQSEEQRTLLSRIVEQSPVSVVVTDIDGSITYVNPRFTTLTGYSSEEALGKNPRVLKTDVTSPETFRDMWTNLTAGKEWSGELCNKRKDGSLFWEMAYLFPIMDSTGSVSHYAGVKENITDRKMYELALIESRQQLSDIIEFLPDATLVVDDDKRVIAWNRSMEEMTGIGKNDILGQENKAHTVPFYGERLGKVLDFLDDDEGSDSAPFFRFRRRDTVVCTETFVPYLYGGTGASLWITAAPLYNSSGVRVGAIESVRDISEQKKVEEELERSKLVAEASNRAKSEFLANMSHEIRTPINAISGMAFLLQKSDLNDSQQDYTRRIISAAKTLLTIITDLLDFSKIEAGHLELESVPFSLPEMCNEVKSITSVMAEQKRLELRCAISANLPTYIIGDPLRLQQILLNLVGNAVKFTETGIVEVSVRSEPSTRSHDSVLLTFTVTDTGIGMDDEQIELIFAPFRQADNSITRRFGGTGLGLSIVKHLIELMDGTMTVVSRSGVGSTFCFTLECAVAPVTDASRSDVCTAPAVGYAEPVRCTPDVMKSLFITEEGLANSVHELAELLRINNVSAAARFNVLKQYLPITPVRSDLERYIVNFDYKNALLALQKLAPSASVTLEE